MAKAPATKESTTAPEVYADGVASVAIRRNVARVTLVSERVDPDKTDSSERVVVGHVAMSLAGFLDMHARMQNIVDQMRDRGAVVSRGESEATGAGTGTAKPAAKKAASKRTRRKKA